MPSTRLASTSSESSRRNGFLSGLDESGGESSPVAAASLVAMAIEGIRDDDDDDIGRLFGADQQQVWKANLDSAPLGTSYTGGSIDRSIDWTTTIRPLLKVKPCNSSSLPASLLAPDLPRLLTNHDAHRKKKMAHVKYNSKLKILGLTLIVKNPP